MKTLRQRLSLAVKERVFRRCGIPFSRHGVDPSVVRFLQASGPLNYVDVGASVGSVARSVDAQYGVRRGILVEPQPARCLELKRCFSAPRFSVHQCALSDRETMCEMEVLEWDYSSSILPVRRDLPKVSAVLDLSVREKINCRVTTLDTLMTEAGWVGSVDLLKIDVQGAELLAFRGAEQTLPRVRFILSRKSRSLRSTKVRVSSGKFMISSQSADSASSLFKMGFGEGMESFCRVMHCSVANVMNGFIERYLQ